MQRRFGRRRSMYFKYNKQNLIKLFNEKPELTEWQIAKKNRMDRIWDCGSMKFILNLS